MKNDRTWIEINAGAFNRNIAYLASLVQPPTQMGVVVKANAYGHGLEAIGTLCQKNDAINWLFTAGVQEAVRLREAGITKSILAMAYLDDTPSLLAQYDIALGVGDIATAQRVCEAGKPVNIHIKVDTGMSRLGFKLANFELELYKLLQLPHLVITGIFTHLSDTNNPDLSFTHQQCTLFQQMVVIAERVTQKKLCAHIAASGSLMLPEHHAIVRVGTSAYGQWKSVIHHQRFSALLPTIELEPIMAWKTRVMQVKTLEPGDAVGYHRTYVAPRHMRVAILPVGYADGYPRALSHKAAVSIRGHLAPVVGLVSMSLLEVDVTDIGSVREGDEVLLCGNIPGLTPSDLGTMSDSVANEFLARLSPDIPRLLV